MAKPFRGRVFGRKYKQTPEREALAKELSFRIDHWKKNTPNYYRHSEIWLFEKGGYQKAVPGKDVPTAEFRKEIKSINQSLSRRGIVRPALPDVLTKPTPAATVARGATTASKVARATPAAAKAASTASAVAKIARALPMGVPLGLGFAAAGAATALIAYGVNRSRAASASGAAPATPPKQSWTVTRNGKTYTAHRRMPVER